LCWFVSNLIAYCILITLLQTFRQISIFVSHCMLGIYICHIFSQNLKSTWYHILFMYYSVCFQNVNTKTWSQFEVSSYIYCISYNISTEYLQACVEFNRGRYSDSLDLYKVGSIAIFFAIEK